MEQHPLLLRVKGYLESVVAGTATMTPEVMDEAAAAFRASLERQFNPKKDRAWRIRMSNIGMPFCRLWHEKNGTKAEPESYNFPMKMAFGDAVEALTFAVLKEAGVPVEATGVHTSMRVDTSDDETVVVNGTADLLAYGGVWDVKSASAYAFQEKFSPPFGWSNLKDNDAFGYLAQGFGYAEGLRKPFRGWVAVSKETGEFSVLEVPQADRKEARAAALDKATETIRDLESGAPFRRCFEDEPEKFKGRETGNRVLGMSCKYCPFKWSCWETLEYERQTASKAASPPFMYYTYIAPENRPDAG
jgi:hypothetical protein